MTEQHIENYLQSVRRQFNYYKSLADKAIAQLDDRELYAQQEESSNSVAILMKHMAGNMLSRWTNFLTSDGEKPWRNRDQEFVMETRDRAKLNAYWEQGWTCLFDAINSITTANFDQTVYIRNMGHTIIDAVNRQQCHYSYHVGQIVLLAKAHKGSQWESLSIPKGKSEQYNAEKFGKDKRKAHFTDDL